MVIPFKPCTISEPLFEYISAALPNSHTYVTVIFKIPHVYYQYKYLEIAITFI